MSAWAANAAECGREAFAAVVNEARAELAAMNESQKASFQQKLQLLKTRQGWADSDFVGKATPFVKDDKIAGFDESNKALLARVPQLGGAVPAMAGAMPSLGEDDRHCAMLESLRALMADLVENTRAKWTYMLGKVETALDAARQAKIGQ